MPDRYTVAVVGAGSIAHTIHLPALAARAGRVQVAAICDVDPGRAGAVAHQWKIPGRYTDVERMIAESAPRLLVVCTPPSEHVTAIRAGLASGAWVWCEKPPTLSLADYDRAVEMERDGGPYVSFVYQHRFGSAAAHLRQLVRDGMLGRPLVAVCHTIWYRDQAYFDVPWRGRWETEGGGPTMGHGIHQIDLLLDVLGGWREVQARVETLDRAIDTEDVSIALLTTEGGALVSVVNSVLSLREVSYLRFDFEHATVELSHLYGYANSNWTFTQRPGSAPPIAAAWPPCEDVASSHAAQLDVLLDHLDTGTRPPIERCRRAARARTCCRHLPSRSDGARGKAVRTRSRLRGLRLDGAVPPQRLSGNRGNETDRLREATREALLSSITVAHTFGTDVSVRCGDIEIVRYVYGEEIAALEAPKPYFHPIRTLSGAVISAYRPHDHRWHKGLQMTISHLSGQNFWGGPTFVQGEGYVQLDNVGSMRHESFPAFDVSDDRLDLVEQLGWFTAAGERWVDERRHIAVHSVDAQDGLWVLDIASQLTNVRGTTLQIGSPTTAGREMAGYTGWFFRGTRAWTGAAALVADPDADTVMSARSRWLAYTGPHDEADGGGTLVMITTSDLAATKHHWFVRTEPFPAVNPSFAFFDEQALDPGDTLEVSYRIVIGDAVWDRERITRVVEEQS